MCYWGPTFKAIPKDDLFGPDRVNPSASSVPMPESFRDPIGGIDCSCSAGLRSLSSQWPCFLTRDADAGGVTAATSPISVSRITCRRRLMHRLLCKTFFYAYHPLKNCCSRINMALENNWTQLEQFQPQGGWCRNKLGQPKYQASFYRHKKTSKKSFLTLSYPTARRTRVHNDAISYVLQTTCTSLRLPELLNLR